MKKTTHMYVGMHKHFQIRPIDDTAGAVYCALGLFVLMIFHIVGVF